MRTRAVAAAIFSAMLRARRFLLPLLPLVVAFAFLVHEAATGIGVVNAVTYWTIYLELLVPIALVLWKLRASNDDPLGTAQLALLCPCFLAPLSIVYPWTVAPTHLGVGYGGFTFFLRWLTKYPNLGPVNYEVLLGMLCVLGSSSMPVLFAAYTLYRKAPTIAVSAFILLASLVPFVPAFVRLDLDLVRMGLAGAPSLVSYDRVPLAFALYGPLMRSLALGSMALLVGVRFNRRSPS